MKGSEIEYCLPFEHELSVANPELWVLIARRSELDERTLLRVLERRLHRSLEVLEHCFDIEFVAVF